MKDDRTFGPLVAVCGAGQCGAETQNLAENVGRLLAELGAVVVCGGLGGVMAAAARGAKEAGGVTVGLLPGDDPGQANPHIDLALPTGLGHLRNALITRAAQVIIAMPGGPGTLSEIALGLKMGKPVIAFPHWSHIEGVKVVQTPEEATAQVCDFLERRLPNKN